ncbi:MAG: GNAT family N-acetyltransferase [Ilumatobacter sp.]|uniref:GNAT family N-acetyltransferase n=1 Tax=Ilumatobacter sp. TaxID=1967498 RepID=UPI003C78D25F
MATSNTIRLEPITVDNWRAAIDVRVTGDQLRLVADHQPIALVILAKAHVAALGRSWEPMAIVSERGIVGVVGIGHGDEDSVIANLAIDLHHQGSGNGQAALAAVIAHCVASDRKKITLTVDPDNQAATALYERAGFAATGDMSDGEPEWTLDLANVLLTAAELVEPTVRLRDAWVDAHHEWGPGVHEDGFGLQPTDDVDSPTGFGSWVRRVSDERGGRRVFRWIVANDRVLGGIALRVGDDAVIQTMGNIGYGIRPSERRRGFATWALGRMIDEARTMGLARLVLVCETANHASAKTIVANGGVLDDASTPGLDPVDRYTIDLAT